MHLTRTEIEDIEHQVDQAFLKHTGRTWREDDDPSQDTLESMARDYPALFKKEE